MSEKILADLKELKLDIQLAIMEIKEYRIRQKKLFRYIRKLLN